MDSSQPSAQPSNDSRPLLGRLFVVPLIIVAVIISCAVVVVLAFGWIASSKQMPLATILTRLEGAAGEKTAGAMVPKDKELWQAAQELAKRLENLETEIDAADLPDLQSRLSRLVERELASVANFGPMRKKRVAFLMLAAAKAQAEQVVPTLVRCLEHSDAELRRDALSALAQMGGVEAARSKAGVVAASLDDADPAVRLVACAALTNLADGDNADVRSALLNAFRYADADLDLRWNTALTLARLHMLEDSEILMMLADMLTRSYWEKQRVVYERPDAPKINRPLTQNEIGGRLIASIQAAANLDDEEVWRLIEALSKDPAVAVIGQARKSLAIRSDDDAAILH